MSDGRTLVGIFICTDKDCNIILGSCFEFLNQPGILIYFLINLGFVVINEMIVLKLISSFGFIEGFNLIGRFQ